MKNKTSVGHMAAVMTVLTWGTTFISTKVLLDSFQPVEILFYRFVLGAAALLAFCPKRLRGTGAGQELTFAAAGLCGITLYFLMENIALTYTMASNVGVIISIAPFFTAILSCFISKGKEKLSHRFLIGFVIAMAGICLISFGGADLQIDPVGDLLAVGASFVWALYSLLMKRISTFGFSTILTTRRVFTYGLLFMVPALFFFDFSWDMGRFTDMLNLVNFLFLGIGASALCFVTWNFAVKVLGALKTSIYIYMVPVVTVTASVLILKERLTLPIVVGIVLTLTGLLISEMKFCKRERA